MTEDELNNTKPTNEIIFNQSVDQLLESLPIGSVSKAIGNNMYGINFRQTGNVVPKAKDSMNLRVSVTCEFIVSTLLNFRRKNIPRLICREKL